jgi:hypothetical protein
MSITQARICSEVYHIHSGTDAIIKQESGKQRAVFLLGTWWDTDAEITVSFLPLSANPPNFSRFEDLKRGMRPGDTLDPLEEQIRGLHPKEAVYTIIAKRIVPLVGLRIRFVDSDGMIRIRLDAQGGSSSLVGTQCLQASPSEYTMTFGWIDVGTVEHEFCHALGMVHEHQNPFGKSIEWNEDIVYEWAQRTQGWDKTITDVNILSKYKKNQINGSTFDPASVMLSFYPANFTKDGKGVEHNNKLSDTDKLWIQSVYPRKGIAREIPSRSASSSQIFQGKHKSRNMILFIAVGVILFVLIIFILVHK